MNIKTDVKNELLKRQELVLEVEDKKNPGFDEVRKQIAEKMGKPEENIDVKKVEGSFGKKIFRIEAYVYESKEDLEGMKKLEMTKKQRGEVEKADEEKKEEALVEDGEEKAVEGDESHSPAQEGSDTAPVEEKVEEVKVEEKPSEAPAEDKPEEEVKAVREESEKKEESKEQ